MHPSPARSVGVRARAVEAEAIQPARLGLDHRGPPEEVVEPRGRQPAESLAGLAGGESVIKYESPLNVLKYTYGYSCY
jgi:hypothetical protein